MTKPQPCAISDIIDAGRVAQRQSAEGGDDPSGGRGLESLLARQTLLHPYQKEGIRFLASKTHALLADEMGLGKSVQAIIAADSLTVNTVLVLCPAVARVNWKREFEKWSTFPNLLSIHSYDEVSRNPGKFAKQHYDLLVLDEAHFLKNRTSKRTKHVLGKIGLTHRAKRTWALTGTPMPNTLDEIWPLLFTFGATKYKYAEFVERYCKTYDTGYGPKVIGIKEQHLDEIHKALDKVMLRRLKAQVLKELPSIYSTITHVEAGPVELDISEDFREYVAIKRTDLIHEQYKLQSELVQKAYQCFESPKSAIAGDYLRTLATSLATLRRINGMKKISAASELISDELENHAYEKIVIFCYHKDVIQGLYRRLKKFGAVFIDGATSDVSRNLAIDSFQHDAHVRVFIGQILACGTAINLSAAHHVVIVEPDWVPSNNAQAIARCHRIGQKRTVHVRFLAIDGSVDSNIIQTLERKTRDATKALRDARLPGEARSKESDEDDDETYFRRNGKAVSETKRLAAIVQEARALKNKLPKELREEEIYGEHFIEPGREEVNPVDSAPDPRRDAGKDST